MTVVKAYYIAFFGLRKNVHLGQLPKLSLQVSMNRLYKVYIDIVLSN
jgi:hypothetical protein